MKDTVLENEWYPVLLEKDLGTEPVPVQLLDEKIVVFRTSQGVHAFRDLCVHRGTQLSLGRVEQDCLICPYHGWTFDHTGQCVRIPAHDSTMKSIPTRARAEAYHCTVKYGLVWVCIGEPRNDICEQSQVVTPEWRTVFCGPYRVSATAPRFMENAIDVSHLSWVHNGIIGDSSRPEINEYKVSRAERGLSTTGIAVAGPNSFNTGEDKVGVLYYEVLAPLTLRIRKTNDETGETVFLVVYVIPESANRSLVYMLRSRNYGLDMPDTAFVEFQNQIVAQDIPILESQRPELLPLDLAAEMHVKADRLSIEYRRWLRELGVTIGTQ